MANFEIPDTPEYSGAMRKLESTDKATAELFNGMFEQLLENGAYLQKESKKNGENKLDKNGNASDTTVAFSKASELAEPVSGGKLSTLFGVIAKAVSSLISHLADTVGHITSAERTTWNSKANGVHTHDDRYYTESETNNLLAGKQPSLGYTPVQQGTGTGQLANVVKIGWSGSRLKATVDATDMGNFVFDGHLADASVKYASSAGSAPASDVYAWAKASAKPSYTKAEVGLGNVDNTADSAKSVKYATSAGSASSATNATNATYSETAHGMRTYNAAGASHGTSWIMKSQHNKKGNGFFDMICGDGSVGVQVDRAVTAGSAESVAWTNVSGRPSSMPASDVYAWAKASAKPTYTYSEVGASASNHTHPASQITGTVPVTISASAPSSGLWVVP